MSFEIPTAFVQQYGSTVEHLVQQKGSRLRNAVSLDTNVVGKTKYYDQIGLVAARKVNNRHGDSPLNSTPHERRRVTLFDYDTGDLIDEPDKLRTLIDPAGEYTMAHAMAMSRAIDDEIISAFTGTAYQGEDGSTSVTFPTTQQVAVNSWAYGTGSGNSGLTISKLIEAANILGENETDPDEPTYIACSQKQISDLLQTTEVTSVEYNSVRALTEGRINTFMGMQFIRTERLLTDSNSYRRVIAWKPSGIKLAMAKDVTARIAPRADKRFSTYAYFCMTLGATRMQEEKVVEIKCSEA